MIDMRDAAGSIPQTITRIGTSNSSLLAGESATSVK